MKKTVFSLFALSALFLCVLSCSAAIAAEQDISLRLGVSASDGRLLPDMAAELGSRTRESSEDHVRIEVVPISGNNAGELVWQGLSNGSLDLAVVDVRDLSARIPALAILSEPFLFADEDAADRFYNGEGGERVAALLEPSGIRIAGWLTTGTAQFYSRIPLESAEDFAAARIGLSPSLLSAVAFQPLVGEIVSMRLPELLLAAQSGVVDALEGTAVQVNDAEAASSLSHAVTINHSFPYLAVCYANTARAKIPAESLILFQDAVRSGIQSANGLAATAAYQAENALRERGLVFQYPSREQFVGKAREALAPAVAGSDAILREKTKELDALKAQDDFGG